MEREVGASRNSVSRGGIEEMLEGAMRWEAGAVSKEQRTRRKIPWARLWCPEGGAAAS